MTNQTHVRVTQDAQLSVTSTPSRFLQRKCSCGKSMGLTGNCSECDSKKLILQRQVSNQAGEKEAPPIMHELPGSPFTKIQPKLRIGAPNDKYEQEADRIAEQVMRMPESSVQRQIGTEKEETIQAKPIGNITPLIKRQTENEETIQTKRTSSPVTTTRQFAQTGIQNLRQSGGRLLPPSTRAFMEPRFGNDFSRVRIHDDSKADVAARAVNARAFTIGNDIFFRTSEFQPRNPTGQRLLAHELTHVIQQGQVTSQQSASDISQEWPHFNINSATHHIQKAPPTEESEVSQDRPERDLVDQNWAGRSLSQPDREGLAEFLFDDIGVTPGDITHDVQGATFLLHDTSGASSRATIEAKAQNARGPLGSGPNVFIPDTGREILQRPNFFDPRRPTTTEFEKGTDIQDQATRETGFRAVWAATNPTQRDTAITRALAGLPLTNAEIATERTGATNQLNASSGKIFTTATWAIREICAEVDRSSAATVANGGQESALTSACTDVTPLLTARRQRIGSTVSVELVQQGARRKGNQNTCDPTNPDILPLPNPPYSSHQYSNTTIMYLRAAVMAGRFPRITTHFEQDSFVRGHCDPRCFDLDQLYSNIAGVLRPLGHGPNSTYGITPSYGLTSGTHNVWWDNGICHGSHP